MSLQPAAQTAMYNQRRQNKALGTPGSTTTAAVRPTEGAIGKGKSYYDYNGSQPGNYWGGSTAPAAPPAPPGGGDSKPPWTPNSPTGYGENWYAANAYQYNHESAANNYWNGVQGQFTGPTQYETGMKGYADQLGNNKSPLESLYDQQYGSGQFTQPTAGEDWWSQNGGQYGAPSQGEQSLGNVVGQLGSTGSMEDWAKQNGGFFTQSGDMEKFFRDNSGALLNNNNLAQHQGGIANDINSARNTGAFFNATAGDLLSPSYTEGLANSYQKTPSYNEQFLLGGGATQGLDQLYSRLYDQGSRRLGNEGAARGSFNSGASLRASEELGADLDAQHVRDYMTASNQADASRLSDQSYGLNLMQGADTSLRGRVSLGLSGANMADTTALGRAKAGQDLYSGVSDETRNNLGLAGDWAQNSQSDALARMTEGGNVANNANSQWLNRMEDTTNAANDQANQWRQRLDSGSQGASRATNDWATRMNTGKDFAQGASDDWMQRMNDAGGMQKTMNDMLMDRLMNGGTLAGNADAGYWNALNQGQTAANSAQNMQENRENNVYRNLSDLGGKQAGTYGQGTDKARDEQRQSMMDEINGLIAKGGITSQMIMNKYGAQMQALGLIIQGGKVVAGAMTGNPGLVAGAGDAPPVPGGSYAGPDPQDANPYGKNRYVV